MGKETKLIEKTLPRIEEKAGAQEPEAPTGLDVPVDVPDPGVTDPATNGRRARPSTGDSVEVEPVPVEQSAPGTGDSNDSNEAIDSKSNVDPGPESRRIARAEKRRRPRAPLAEKITAPRESVTAGDEEPGEGTQPATSASVGAAEALVISLSGEKLKRGLRTAKRARGKQEVAAAALASAEDHPALGALNRHLNMLTNQLETAHRVIGRVAAERDALRQQVADLHGVPVEEIGVTSLDESKVRRSKAARAGQAVDPPGIPAEGIAIASPGQSEVRRSKAARDGQDLTGTDTDESRPPSVMSRLNYFSVEDIAVARRRRQRFVLGLLLVLLVIGLASRLGAIQMPDKVSRDSLAALPFIGDFMSIFLAGWLFFRVFKVGSKGVKWVFPSEDRKRRRW